MIIKGWKKTGKNSWEFTKDSDSITTLEIWKNRVGGYTITMIPTTGKDIHLNRTRTYEQAVDFATRFMKQHPNG